MGTHEILILIGIVLTFSISMLKVWGTLNTRLTKLESETRMKFLQLEKEIGLQQNSFKILSTLLVKISDSNNEAHEKLIDKIDTVKNNINEIKIEVAKIKK